MRGARLASALLLAAGACGEGDALVFEAIKLQHGTEPLVPSARNEKPLKVVAVARYFF